jgi:hypothetical protein
MRFGGVLGLVPAAVGVTQALIGLVPVRSWLPAPARLTVLA